MPELLLIEPSKELETAAMLYRNDYIEHGEDHINGSCGFIHYSNYDEWLQKVALANNKDTSYIKCQLQHILQCEKQITKLWVLFNCVMNSMMI